MNLRVPFKIIRKNIRSSNVGNGRSCLVVRNPGEKKEKMKKIRKACRISTSCQPRCCIIELNDTGIILCMLKELKVIKLFSVDGSGDSEMVFGEMRPTIRHRLPHIRLTVGKPLKEPNQSLTLLGREFQSRKQLQRKKMSLRMFDERFVVLYYGLVVLIDCYPADSLEAYELVESKFHNHTEQPLLGYVRFGLSSSKFSNVSSYGTAKTGVRQAVNRFRANNPSVSQPAPSVRRQSTIEECYGMMTKWRYGDGMIDNDYDYYSVDYDCVVTTTITTMSTTTITNTCVSGKDD
ncbi:hypothetical protein ANN_11493 [Periplaneta americana]|uniref:Uncharacterized protein n=1 Tax=Periplaneta americana TaxID=6978 RepID=A0ABQ8T6W1_PERAM|nr:hypothetical protein ANN_11493 [Periplaneta americana]